MYAEAGIYPHIFNRPVAFYLFPIAYAATVKRGHMHSSSIFTRSLTTCYMCVASQTSIALGHDDDSIVERYNSRQHCAHVRQ